MPTPRQGQATGEMAAPTTCVSDLVATCEAVTADRDREFRLHGHPRQERPGVHSVALLRQAIQKWRCCSGGSFRGRSCYLKWISTSDLRSKRL